MKALEAMGQNRTGKFCKYASCLDVALDTSPIWKNSITEYLAAHHRREEAVQHSRFNAEGQNTVILDDE
jgi:hypothetical protein